MSVIDILFGSEHLIALAGPRGSGKTELALNLMAHCERVQVFDADMYKPIMRARDVGMGDRREGTTVPEWKYMDTPVIEYSPEVWLSKGLNVVLDMGGGELGLVPLNVLRSLLKGRNINFFVVVNPYRPHSRFLIDRIVSMLPGRPSFILNPHLLEETDEDVVLRGLEMYEQWGLPKPVLLVVMERLANGIEKVANLPLFPIQRYLTLEVS